MPSCPKAITLTGHGQFHQGKDHWSSHHTKVVFKPVLNRSGTEVTDVKIVRRYGQSGLSQRNKSNFVKPVRIVNKNSLCDRAQTIFQSRLDGESRGPRSKNNMQMQEEDKTHKTEHCERCKELGHNCSKKR